MAETVPVTFTVIGVERVQGTGRLIGLAIVELDFAGVILTLQGVQVVRELNGSLSCKPPVFRHPKTGRWLAAVVLPPTLAEAIGHEVVSWRAEEISQS